MKDVAIETFIRNSNKDSCGTQVDYHALLT
jgi:hypothetical protein